MERGNAKHGPRQDEELAHEAQPIVQGHGSAHAEGFRESEPLPDDTDDAEVRDAYGSDPAIGSPDAADPDDGGVA